MDAVDVVDTVDTVGTMDVVRTVDTVNIVDDVGTPVARESTISYSPQTFLISVRYYYRTHFHLAFKGMKSGVIPREAHLYSFRFFKKENPILFKKRRNYSKLISQSDTNATHPFIFEMFCTSLRHRQDLPSSIIPLLQSSPLFSLRGR